MMKRIFPILNLIFITAAVYFSVQGFYMIATATQGDIAPFQVSGKQDISPENKTFRPFAYYRTVIERDLFKSQKKGGEKPKPVDLERLAQTDLKLKLWGTVTGKSRAYAVIEDTKERKQNLYRVGDAVQDATVKQIEREAVVLRVKGRDEKLLMEKVPGGKKTRTRTSRPSRRSKPANAFNIKLKRSMIDKAMGDLNSLMGQVKIRPHFEDGKPSGLFLTSIKPGSIFQKMGLRNGDILVGVDGKDIESADDALKLYSDLKAASSVMVDIKRRGRMRTIDYQIE